MNGAFNLGDLSQRNFYKEFHEANQYLIKMSYLQIFKVKRKTHSQFYFISFYSLYSLYSKTILIGANSSINIFLPGFFLVLQKKNLKLLKRRFLHTIVKNLLKISSWGNDKPFLTHVAWFDIYNYCMTSIWTITSTLTF